MGRRVRWCREVELGVEPSTRPRAEAQQRWPQRDSHVPACFLAKRFIDGHREGMHMIIRLSCCPPNSDDAVRGQARLALKIALQPLSLPEHNDNDLKGQQPGPVQAHSNRIKDAPSRPRP